MAVLFWKLNRINNETENNAIKKRINISCNLFCTIAIHSAFYFLKNSHPKLKLHIWRDYKTK